MLKKVFVSVVLFAALTLNGCITRALWGDKFYEERISQVLIGADARYIVLVGEKYHYVFTDNRGYLRQILSLKQRGILTIHGEESNLRLEENNQVNGDIVFEGPFGVLPQEDKYMLQSMGARPDSNDEIKIKIGLSGMRYAAKYLSNQENAASNVNYTMKVYYSESDDLATGIGKAAITPIAVGIDAVWFIGKVVVYPLVM